MDEAPKGPDPFDVRTIKYLVRLMSRHDLSEIDLKQGDHRIRLRPAMEAGWEGRGLALPPPTA